MCKNSAYGYRLSTGSMAFSVSRHMFCFILSECQRHCLTLNNFRLALALVEYLCQQSHVWPRMTPEQVSSFLFSSSCLHRLTAVVALRSNQSESRIARPPKAAPILSESWAVDSPSASPLGLADASIHQDDWYQFWRWTTIGFYYTSCVSVTIVYSLSSSFVFFR